MFVTNKYHGLQCKICNSKTSILGVCDFNKSCEEEKKKKVFPWIGFPIYYHQCINCGFIFTTDFDDARSADYCTSVAAMIQAPVLHVNGDDAEAVVKCAEIATRYRQEFNSDIFIDMV